LQSEQKKNNDRKRVHVVIYKTWSCVNRATLCYETWSIILACLFT